MLNDMKCTDLCFLKTKKKYETEAEEMIHDNDCECQVKQNE